MTSAEELMRISREYHKHKKEIEALIEYQLQEGRPQVSICNDFGMTVSQVHSRAKARGISYYRKKA